MDVRLLTTVFTTVFLAEIGDKTQLATMLYAGESAEKKWTVFLGSAAALVVASGLGVFVGAKLGPLVDPAKLRWVAGLGFVAIGVWTMLRG
jgi:putative Ca2+/H+ antiporter (TMEM165/GDT1 family)